MKFGLDIGGCASKYPRKFLELVLKMAGCIDNVFIITDMHEKDKVLEMLEDNGFGFILKENVYCADYNKYGNFCKAVLLKELGIDIFIDDFEGYLCWDSKLGPAPIRLLVMPDNFKPYWSPDWKVRDDFDFGRKVVSSPEALEGK